MFQFKQFNIRHDRCAMKVGTDGLLLGCLTELIPAGKTREITPLPRRILDIGTGTGLIALVLAQRNSTALIDAVELDTDAAQQAAENFAQSPWSNRLKIHHQSILSYPAFPFVETRGITHQQRTYDLIVSNPPYFLKSLKSIDDKKQMARHAEGDFFPKLCLKIKELLNPEGQLWIILPPAEMTQFKNDAAEQGLYPLKSIHIRSFDHSPVKRVITVFSRLKGKETIAGFSIYKSQKEHSESYKKLVKDFLLDKDSG